MFQQTKTQWAKMFYLTSGVLIVLNIFYFIFGSSEEQSWNKKQTKEEEMNTPKTNNKSICSLLEL